MAPAGDFDYVESQLQDMLNHGSTAHQSVPTTAMVDATPATIRQSNADNNSLFTTFKLNPTSHSSAFPSPGRSASTSPSVGSASSNKPQKVEKRQRNTEAARRYRQRKVDRVTDLETALAAVTRERDELRLALAKAEAQSNLLRDMMKAARP